MRATEFITEDWNKANRRDKTDGLSQKAVNAYRRENPGSKLQTAVTTKPSKLKPGSKAAKRRKSFCARMSGNKGPMKKPNGKPTPKALALRRWNCESVEEMVDMIIENVDHDKDNQVVPELKAALLAKKSTLQNASEDDVYDIVDTIMTRIAKSHGISGKKLHDMWVDEYDQIPDTWIMTDVKEAEINQQFPPVAPLPQLKVPPIPRLTAPDGDLGNGSRVTTNADGTRSYSSGMGTFTYDAQGKAITYTSPKMSGYGQTIDLATNQIVHDYHAGPLQLNYKADAQGRPITSRAKYDLGAATLGYDQDHVSGIRSTEVAPRVGDGTDTAATLAAAHQIMPTSVIAKAKGVDPAKFAAFQKQNPTAVKEDDTELKTSSDAEIRARLRLAAQQGKGTKLKDMNPLDRDQWLKSTGQYWDNATQSVKPLPVKESADDKLLQQMLSIAGLI